MKFTVLQTDLKDSLSLTSHFITNKAQLPILGNVYLKAYKSRLTLAATNLETSVSTSIGAKIQEEGEITINGKVLFDIVSNLRSGSVDITVIGEEINIKSSNFKSTLMGILATDFPQVPDKVPSDNQIKLNKKEIISALNKTVFAVSNDETRPVLTGILFKFSEKELELVATDGFRLSKVDLKFNQKVDFENFIVPRNAITELTKLTQGDEILLSYSKSDNLVIFGVGDVVLSSRVIEGSFPDFEKIIPKSSSFRLAMDKEDLDQATKLSGVFAREAGNVVKLNIKKDTLIVLAESSNSGSQETEVEAKIETDEKIPEEGITISYNFRFIEEFLKSVEGDEVVLEVTNTNSAGKFLDPKFFNYLHLIMPIRSNS